MATLLVDEPCFKMCSKCGFEGTPDAFRPKTRTCINCDRDRAREYMRQGRALNPEAHREHLRKYRRENPERVNAWVQKKNLGAMGLTPERFLEVLAEQGGCCAVCKRTEPGGKGRWHVDHDHTCCGRKKACDACFRGLLCFNCNIALGYLGDSPALLLAAADYLMRKKSDT